MTASARDPEALRRNLAHEIYLDIKVKHDLWHERLGHPSTTILRRMLPLLTSHSLVKAYAEKTHDCVTCIQGVYIKRPLGWTLPTELPHPRLDFMRIYVVQ